MYQLNVGCASSFHTETNDAYESPNSLPCMKSFVIFHRLCVVHHRCNKSKVSARWRASFTTLKQWQVEKRFIEKLSFLKIDVRNRRGRDRGYGCMLHWGGDKIMKAGNAREKRSAGKLEHSQVWEGIKGLPTAISNITPMSSNSFKITILITPSFDESI